MQVRRVLIIAAIALATAIPATAARPPAAGAQCARLEARIAELRLKLRMGYSAKQGRLYRQRLAALEDEKRHVCR